MIPELLAAKHGADMTVDEIVLRALERGPVTVDDIIWRLEIPVRIKLEKLRVRGVVIREGRGGRHRKFTFRLLHPDRAAKALSEKGGGLSLTAKAAPEAQPPAQGELPSASIAWAARQRQRASLKRSNHSRGRRKQEES
jgi:predicted ArsR family transcriptional regulator